MFLSNSLERQRDDIDLDEFRRHWLHPHGPMTAQLPGTRRYVQNHVVFTRGTNALARLLRIQGVAQLGYDSLEARHAAYDSPELVKSCDADTPLFVGAVTRVVTECTDAFPANERDLSKAIVLVPRLSLPKQTVDTVLEQLHGVRRYAGHRIIEQAGPPSGKIPALGLEVDLLLELWFDNDDDLVRCCEKNEEKKNNIAFFHIKPYYFI